MGLYMGVLIVLFCIFGVGFFVLIASPSKTKQYMDKILVLINLLGAGVFFFTAATFQDQYKFDESIGPGASGGLLFVAALMLFWLIAIFALLNFMLIFWACIVYWRKRRWILGRTCLLIPVFWAVPFLIIYSLR